MSFLSKTLFSLLTATVLCSSFGYSRNPNQQKMNILQNSNNNKNNSNQQSIDLFNSNNNSIIFNNSNNNNNMLNHYNSYNGYIFVPAYSQYRQIVQAQRIMERKKNNAKETFKTLVNTICECISNCSSNTEDIINSIFSNTQNIQSISLMLQNFKDYNESKLLNMKVTISGLLGKAQATSNLLEQIKDLQKTLNTLKNIADNKNNINSYKFDGNSIQHLYYNKQDKNKNHISQDNDFEGISTTIYGLYNIDGYLHKHTLDGIMKNINSKGKITVQETVADLIDTTNKYFSIEAIHNIINEATANVYSENYTIQFKKARQENKKDQFDLIIQANNNNNNNILVLGIEPSTQKLFIRTFYNNVGHERIEFKKNIIDKNIELTDKNIELEKRKDKYKMKYGNLEGDYKNLEEDYKDLEGDYKNLKKDYKNLEEDYKNLKKDYKNLQRKYKVLERENKLKDKSDSKNRNKNRSRSRNRSSSESSEEYSRDDNRSYKNYRKEHSSKKNRMDTMIGENDII